MAFLGTQSKNMKRVNEIVDVLRKYEVEYLIEQSSFLKRLPFRNRKEEELDLDDTFEMRIRLSFEELGATFIKLGQLLSTRPDLVGQDLAYELTKLQDDAPPIPFETVKEIIESELDDDMENLFAEFEEKPIGSASIGQVHKAKFHNGTEVAVKVQKPGVEELIDTDLDIMHFFAGRVNQFVRRSRVYNFPAIISEFERSIKMEINYKYESSNISHLKNDFKNDRTVYVPEVYNRYTTSKVLTMEYIRGKKVSEVMENPEGYDPKLIAKRGLDSYIKQILFNGFFHADPHQGNIMIMPNNVICYIDMGSMGVMDEDFRNDLAQLFQFIISKNVNGIINQLNYMDILDRGVPVKDLKYDINSMVNRYYGAELDNFTSGVDDLMNLMVKYEVSLPREFVLMARGFSLIEDMGMKLDPEFDVFNEVQPLARKLISKKLSPKTLFDYMQHNVVEVEHFMRTLPHDINDLIYKIQNDKISIELKIKDLTFLINQISISIIIAALLVGSSLVIMSDVGYEIFDIPILGLIGFSISLILGILIVIDQLTRQGKY
ncbi:MAG: AarF/ABC1/UbiB kinase family protein [Methanobrevibacter sp.]|nr:AarF/ABC1/UbiB kinase family protein [Methanobrevibacter sp.]